MTAVFGTRRGRPFARGCDSLRPLVRARVCRVRRPVSRPLTTVTSSLLGVVTIVLIGLLGCPSSNPAYDPNVRQLLHVGFKIAAQLGDTYIKLYRNWTMPADGSADAMKRNLESRVETVVPVEGHESRVQPGAILPVKVDPENRELVALDIYEERK